MVGGFDSCPFGVYLQVLQFLSQSKDMASGISKLSIVHDWVRHCATHLGLLRAGAPNLLGQTPGPHVKDKHYSKWTHRKP